MVYPTILLENGGFKEAKAGCESGSKWGGNCAVFDTIAGQKPRGQAFGLSPWGDVAGFD
jgi:hypothetical protein